MTCSLSKNNYIINYKIDIQGNKVRKAIHIPTSTNVIVINKIDELYVTIFIDGEEKTVSVNDIEYLKQPKLSSFEEVNESIFSNIIANPVSDLLYSYNTNRLIPEHHQYRPLIKMLNSTNNRLLIADEVGLGKTIEAGMIFKEIDKRDDIEIALIVVPSSLTLKWKEEMLIRFSEEFEILKTNQFRAFLKEYSRYSDSRVFVNKMIVSYHTLRDDDVIELLKETSLHIDILIMDEAHSFRNNETSTFEGAALVTGIAENILFLTATPVQNSINDLFNILSLLDEDSFLDREHFEKSIRPNSLIHKVVAMLKNGAALEEVQIIIQKADRDYLNLSTYQESLFDRFLQENGLIKETRVDYIRQFTDMDNLSYIINRTKKKDVGNFIPREAVSRTVKGTAEEVAFYKEVIEFVKLLFHFKNPKIPSGFITIMPERMASSCMLASIESFRNMRKSRKLYIGDFDDRDEELVGMDIQEFLLGNLDTLIEKGEAIGKKDSKFEAFEQVVDGLIEQNINKMIVFSFFKKTLAYLEDKLSSKGIRVGKIDGDLTPEERFEKINDFRDDKFDILLSSEVGSEGLDMQFCNVVVNYDLPWNPMRVEQRIGRIDRIGQKADKLLVFNFCIEGTVEDRILNRLYSKLNIFENSIGELEPILGDIQSTFDLQEMIDLSEEELQRVIDLEAQALIRKKQEIVEQSTTLEGMLNEDYYFDESYENYVNGAKEKFVREGVKKIFLKFLHRENIKYLELKDGTYRLNKEEAMQLFENLKSKMVDAREKVVYSAQKKTLIKLKRSKFYHFSFSKIEHADYDLEYISLSHPFVKMLREQYYFPLYANIEHPNHKDGYAIVFREEIKVNKQFSTLKVLLVDRALEVLKVEDYYLFSMLCENGEYAGNIEKLQEIKSSIEPLIIKIQEERMIQKRAEVTRLVNQKIKALQEYYAKKRANAQKMKAKVNDLDVIRMRQGQISNLYELEKKKVVSLEKQKEVTSSHQIVAILGLSNE